MEPVNRENKPEMPVNAVKPVKKIIPVIIALVAVLGVIFLAAVICVASYYFKNIYLNSEEKAAVESTIAAIDGIGDVTVDSGTAIAKAEAAYGQLIPKCQKKITNLDVLTGARKKYDLLKAEEISKEIDSFEVKWGCGEELNQLLNSYNGLSDEQKNM